MRGARDHRRRQRNVGGNHQIARLHLLDNVVVRDVEPGRHLQRADVPGRRRVQRLVGDEDQRNALALGGTKQDVLDDLGTGVGIDPDLHGFAGV